MIKIKWNNMTPEQKLYVKESAMTIMDKGIQDIIKEPNHIKDAIARIIVEVINLTLKYYLNEFAKALKK